MRSSGDGVSRQLQLQELGVRVADRFRVVPSSADLTWLAARATSASSGEYLYELAK